MSLLNQLFNRGLIGPKCRTCLTLAISRIKLLQNKRDMQLKLMRKEIAQFLQTGQEAIARIRVEHVIREQNIWAAYEILEMFCEFVLARVPILESERECPSELKEAIASIIFAAPRCSDVPDLLSIRNMFAAKYGKDFISAATELRPDTSVNRTIIEKLSVYAPSPEARLSVLKEIAKEYSVAWDSSKTEAEFNKMPEDLLNGPKHIPTATTASPPPPIQNSLEETPKVTHSVSSPRNQQGAQTKESSSPSKPKESSSPSKPKESSTKDQNVGPVSLQSSDVMERARIAIAAADRASAAARAAADLVKVDYRSHELEAGKS